MDPKLLTESGWKATASKYKIKDNGLQRALAAYEKLDDEEHEDRIEGIDSVSKLAGALKRAREVAAAPDVVEYLDDVIDAAESEKHEITKAKAVADKAEAMTQKKAGAEAKKADEDEEEEEEEEEEEDDDEEEDEDYAAKLLAAFQKLKGAKDTSYQFLVCDAKPVCGVMVAKKITPKHKEQLTKATGGSKRFLPVGTCSFQDGKFTFSMDKPVTGLARKLQDSIKNFTGKKFPIKVGTEAAEDDEGQPSAGAGAATPESAAAPKPERPELETAPEVWHQTREVISTSIDQLKAAIQKEFAEEDPGLLTEINKNMEKLDGILDKLDRKLAESLAKAHTAANPAARATELKNAKTILMDYLKYVKSEPLIAEIDANPFGVKTNLRPTLVEKLTHMAQVIG